MKACARLESGNSSIRFGFASPLTDSALKGVWMDCGFRCRSYRACVNAAVRVRTAKFPPPRISMIPGLAGLATENTGACNPEILHEFGPVSPAVPWRSCVRGFDKEKRGTGAYSECRTLQKTARNEISNTFTPVSGWIKTRRMSACPLSRCELARFTLENKPTLSVFVKMSLQI